MRVQVEEIGLAYCPESRTGKWTWSMLGELNFFLECLLVEGEWTGEVAARKRLCKRACTVLFSSQEYQDEGMG